MNLWTFQGASKKVLMRPVLSVGKFHRDTLSSDGSMLGTAQWAWLEKEMKGPATEITIIGSSIQLPVSSKAALQAYLWSECLWTVEVMSNLSAVTGPRFSSESWVRFPTERERLFMLVHESKRNGVLFLSGDVHFGEISRYDCGVSYFLYDITSNGLTQAVEKAIPWPLHFASDFWHDSRQIQCGLWVMGYGYFKWANTSYVSFGRVSQALFSGSNTSVDYKIPLGNLSF